MHTIAKHSQNANDSHCCAAQELTVERQLRGAAVQWLQCVNVRAGTRLSATQGALKGDSFRMCSCGDGFWQVSFETLFSLVPASATWFLLSSFLLACIGSVKVFTVI